VLDELDEPPRVVFVTAHDHFAVKAFEANAVDYLLKPVHPDRLAETIRRLENASLAPAAENAAEAAGTTLETVLTLRDSGVVHRVPVREIAAIRAEGGYTRVYRSGGSPVLVLQAIGKWEAILPSPP